MRQKVKNTLHITVEGADLSGAIKPLLFLRQGFCGFYGEYEPAILSADEVMVVIPYEDAMQLRAGRVTVQMAWVDNAGEPVVSDPAEVEVGVLLKEAGYDPA